MNETQLRSLLARGESSQVEFKRHLVSPVKAAQSLTALANTAGGWFVIGVEDNGQISGVQNLDCQREYLQTAALHYSDPPLKLEIVELQIQGRSVIIAEVPNSIEKPHAVLIQGSTSKVYVRYEASNQPAGPTLVKQLRSRVDSPVEPTLNPLEQALIQYLVEHPRITLKTYCRLVNISKQRAKRLLYQLVQTGILNVFEHERETYYALIQSPPKK